MDTVVIAVVAAGAGLLVGGVIGWFVGRGPGVSSSEGGSSGGTVEIYVGNLSYDVNQKDLLKAFEKFGTVTSARIIKNRFNGKSKGYGFVEMPNSREANEAIKALDGSEMKGRRLVANEAKSRQKEE